jgi:hypothetical protein
LRPDRVDSPRRVLLSLLLPSMLNLPHHSLVVPFATKRLGPPASFSCHTGLSAPFINFHYTYVQ